MDLNLFIAEDTHSMISTETQMASLNFIKSRKFDNDSFSNVKIIASANPK